MHIHVRTTHSISKGSYSSKPGKPFQGAIQGNGLSTALWIIVSIFLLRYLTTFHPPPEFLSPMSLILIIIFAIMYIDDTDFFIMNKGDESAADITARAQALLNT